MRRILIVGNMIGSLIVFGLASDLFHHLIMFVLFGMLPWSEQPVPASTMLALWMTLLAVMGRRSVLSVARQIRYGLALVFKISRHDSLSPKLKLLQDELTVGIRRRLNAKTPQRR